MDYEKILTDIGGFGRAQLLIFLTLSFSSFKAALDMEILAMSLHKPKFRCAEQNTSTYEQQSYGHHCTIKFNNYSVDGNTWSNGTTKCNNYDFKHGVLQTSMVEDFGILCDDSWKSSLMMSMYFLGNGIGMLFGTVGDKIGRKKILTVCSLIDIATTPLPAFMPTYETQVFARFIKGLSSAIYYQGLLVVSELTSIKYRGILGNLYWIFWCIGYASSGCIVYWLKEWRTFQLFTTVFCINYIIMFFVVPESPRWLIVRGRKKEATLILTRIAKWNGINMNKEHLKKIEIEEQPTGRIIDLFKYPEMRKKTLVIFYILTMFAFCYFGLSTDTTFVTSHIALNAIFNGAVEIPSSIVGWIFSDKFGRKWPTVVMTVIAGSCVIAVPNIPSSNMGWMVKAVVALTGKFLLTAAYCIMDVYAAELLPTSVRNNGLFLSAFLAMIGIIVAPFINNLNTIAHYLPGLIFGVFAIFSAFSVMFLPETNNMPMPDTIEEAESFKKGKEKQWAENYLKKNDSSQDVEMLLPHANKTQKC